MTGERGKGKFIIKLKKMSINSLLNIMTNLLKLNFSGLMALSF